MRNTLIPLVLGLLVCVLFTLPARAQEAQGSRITVWGVVVDTDFGLVINDGSTDYLLLGVTDTQLQGKTCEVTGTATNTLGIDAINVETIDIIGDATNNNYSMNFRRGQSAPEQHA